MENIVQDAKSYINKNLEGSFAHHVFSKEQALEFVSKLYELGALGVSVGNISAEEDWDGPEMYRGKALKTYADELIIDLPEEKGKRESIFTYLNNFREDTVEDYQEGGQKSISVYWDY